MLRPPERVGKRQTHPIEPESSRGRTARMGAVFRSSKTQENLMKPLKILAALGALAAVSTVTATAADISGAGATFPYPIYAKWAEAYKKQTGTGLNYQSIGSGGGIRQIRAKTVDFGATDAPLKGDDLQKEGLVQFPTVLGGVVPIVNLAGVPPGRLKLTGEILADIYRGEIKTWNDPQIAELNA